MGLFSGYKPRVLTPAPEKPPNIIFILADDMGWGDLGNGLEKNSTRTGKGGCRNHAIQLACISNQLILTHHRKSINLLQ